LVRGLSARGFEVHVVVPSPDLPAQSMVVPSVAASRISVYPIPASPLALDQVARHVERLDQMFRFDVFHGMLLHLALACATVADRGGRPLIVGIRSHELDLLHTRGYDAVAASALRRADWVAYSSAEAARDFRAIVDFSAKESFVPIAVDAKAFDPWFPTDHNRGVVGTVSSFRPQRLLPGLVDAYAALPSSLRRRLVLIGETSGPKHAPIATEVGEAIRRTALEGEVEVTGRVQAAEVRRRLLDLNVFVRASQREGLPSAVLEAAACGTPLIASTVGSIPEVFRDGESALLVPPGDQVRLTGAIRAVLEDTRLAQRLSSGGQAVARAFSPEQEQAAWQEVYRRCLRLDGGSTTEPGPSGNSSPRA